MQARLEGNQLAQQGDWQGARSKYAIALSLAPPRSQHTIHSNLSLVALNNGDPEEALREAKLALQTAPSDWITVWLRFLKLSGLCTMHFWEACPAVQQS
jgi:Flp pilus assembly protein TadD